LMIAKNKYNFHTSDQNFKLQGYET